MGGKRRKVAPGKPPAPKGAGAGRGKGKGGPPGRANTTTNTKPAKSSSKGGGSSNMSSAGKATATTTTTTTKAPSAAATEHPPTIPFAPEHRILLVGDGDLSFAASLVDHHCCADVTATVLEKGPRELAEKYPQAAENAARVEAEDGCRVLYGVDATTMKPFAPGGRRRRGRKNGKNKNKSEEEKGEAGEEGGRSDQGAKENRGGNEDASDREDDDDDDDDDDEHDQDGNKPGRDTRKEKENGHDDQGSSSGAAAAGGLMDRIIFNFPHVGGKSTDVNRQVRYNQEMLVAFFRRALPSLAARGQVVVTLFEGEPYTLWNVRDLARHAGGLRLERSFRFRAAAYPGYRHARTLGVVRTHAGAGAPSETGWRGEERPARSYVFVRKDDPPVTTPTGGGGGKRRRGQDSDSDDD